MIVCGIDGGKPPKTSFAFQKDGVWRIFRQPPAKMFDLVAAEKPTGVVRSGRTPASMVSSGGWGMAGLFSCHLAYHGVRVWLPTEVWKRKLLGGAWAMRKEKACANFVRRFGLELDPQNPADQDGIDAVAIAAAAEMLDSKEIRKWLVQW